MAKSVWTFIFITTGIMLLIAMAGIDTGSSVVMRSVVDGDIAGTEGIQNSEFFTRVSYYIGLVLTVSAVVIGIYGRQTFTDTIAAGLATYVFFAFLGDMIQLIGIANNYAAWAGMGIKLLILPLCVGYVAAMFDWVRGRD